jgi:hypothetical protein
METYLIKIVFHNEYNGDDEEMTEEVLLKLGKTYGDQYMSILTNLQESLPHTGKKITGVCSQDGNPIQFFLDVCSTIPKKKILQKVLKALQKTAENNDDFLPVSVAVSIEN